LISYPLWVLYADPRVHIF